MVTEGSSYSSFSVDDEERLSLKIIIARLVTTDDKPQPVSACVSDACVCALINNNSEGSCTSD